MRQISDRRDRPPDQVRQVSEAIREDHYRAGSMRSIGHGPVMGRTSPLGYRWFNQSVLFGDRRGAKNQQRKSEVERGSRRKYCASIDEVPQLLENPRFFAAINEFNLAEFMLAECNL